MHLYIATKGIKNKVDQFITELQGKYLPFPYRDSVDKQFENAVTQLSVRPIQLWEIGYPKGSHDVVCNTILGEFKDYKGVCGNDGTKPCEHKWTKKFITMFRKLLHLDKIPEWKGNLALPVQKDAVLIIGLGTKQDYDLDSGTEGL